MRKNLKKGVTLLETVIAIALLAIISVVAVSVSVSSIKSEEKNIQAMEISFIAENAIECFRFADNNDKFIEALNKTTDSEHPFNKLAEEGAEANDKKSTYTYVKSAYKVVIVADYTTNTIQITAEDKNGKTIYSLSYKRSI